jgi:hypothetical protein
LNASRPLDRVAVRNRCDGPLKTRKAQAHFYGVNRGSKFKLRASCDGVDGSQYEI